MNRTIIVLLIAGFLSSSFIHPETPILTLNNSTQLKWEKSFEEAQKKARKKNKLLLVLFTGSDWCPPCKNLHKYFFETEEFADIAGKELILYMADFPRQKDLYDAETIQTNRSLKSKYNVRGFPTVVILSPAGKEIARRVGFGFDHDTQYHFKMLRKAIAEYKH